MIFFSRKHSVVESGLFASFKDYHSHILPAVDDGVKSLDESLSILEYFSSLGISDVVLTPHVMSNINQTDEVVNAAFTLLQEAYSGPIKLSLASEYMLDTDFPSQLSQGLRCIDEESVLVESSFFAATLNFEDMLYDINASGLTPVIAHPERYQYMSKQKYHSLKERDYDFQLNIVSLAGTYGSHAAESATYLLEHGLYNFMGTDIHNLNKFSSRLSQFKLSAKHIDMLFALKR